MMAAIRKRSTARGANSAAAPAQDAETSSDEIAKTFTGQKLDWMKCVAFDTCVSPRAFEVGFCIIQHVNARTCRAFLSDETIADGTGSCLRDVGRARKQLRLAGWLTWKRTGGANLYEPLFHRINAVLDAITDKRDQRQERRQRKGMTVDWTRVSHRQRRDTTSESERDPTPKSNHDRTSASDIHLRSNTLD